MSVIASGGETARLPAAKLWMRPISFSSLHRIVGQVYKFFPEEFTAAEVNRLILKKGIVVPQRRSRPSATTLYHYRNTLVRLGIMLRTGRLLRLATDNPLIKGLVEEDPEEGELTPAARRIYRRLVFANRDCREVFLDLFMPAEGGDGPSEFLELGTHLLWRDMSRGSQRSVWMSNPATGRELYLCTGSEVQAILYGLRYWGRDQLFFLDEFFREDMGAILYPVKDVRTGDEAAVQEAIRESICSTGEWTTVSVRELALNLCVPRRWPLALLFTALKSLRILHPGDIALIPTSRGFASIGAKSFQREEFELRGYLRDEEQRVISHVRLHRDLRRGLVG